MVEQPPGPQGPAGLYLHFPFCAIRCTYCDFPTVAGHDEQIEAYLDALGRELLSYQAELPRPVDTVFLGGGTPSRMSPPQLERLLEAVTRRFDVAHDAEITIEANPESLDDGQLLGYRSAGVNRISIGVQSLDDRVLRGVGRAHDRTVALKVLRDLVAKEGLQVNVDLIAGLPGEDLGRWPRTVRRIAQEGPDHVSIYLLETDKETPLARAVRSGRTRLADDAAVARAYEESVETLERLGLAQYEISNFARVGCHSRHNLKYWTDGWYGGFGLGAAAYHHGRRRANRRDLGGYLEAIEAGADPLAECEPWDPRLRLEEALFTGLRLVRGVELDRLGNRYRVDLGARYGKIWDRAEARGMLEREGAWIRLTPRGRLHSDFLFRELIGAA